VEPNGIITTVAGTGSKGVAGDGAAATAASLSNRVVRITPEAAQQFAGQPVYVHGISPIPELPNSTIANSGKVLIPSR
jgi:hypothetical protein